MNTHQSPKRKRASRKGQSKRFECRYEGCNKIYSRHEHLQRHQLNHSPKHVYRCEVDGCNHTFVRRDLFIRHQTKHEEASQETAPQTTSPVQDGTLAFHEPSSALPPRRSANNAFDFSETSHEPIGSRSADETRPAPDWHRAAHDGSLLSRDFNATEVPRNPPRGMTSEVLDSIPGFGNDWMTVQSRDTVANLLTSSPHQGNENFASWLFDSPGSQNQNFDLTNLPYVDFGIDYCSPLNDFWNLDATTTPIAGPSADIYGVAAQSGLFQGLPPTSPRNHAKLSSARRAAVISQISSFFQKKRPSNAQKFVHQKDLLFSLDGYHRPNITFSVLESCLSIFWKYIAAQLPVIHQPTFSCDDCHILLLLSMIMLGAGHVVQMHPKGAYDDYRALADLLAINLRWEIFPDDDAQPPIKLWVAQALLLLEFYEKMYSTRQLHERAHTHHASTLTLLRRGSPMVGTSGSETPDASTRCPTPNPRMPENTGDSNPLSWWHRWAKNESWHRVVFAGFQMDTLHAVLFGHESVLLPYEIRLPLPCDDSLWTAQSPGEVHRLEETFSMHGIDQQPFLDSLKKCLHGYEVHSHYDSRMILIAGLLSVGWHINRREKHLQFLGTTPSTREQERWQTLLFQAYGHWCQSFERAIDNSKARRRSAEGPRDITSDPSVIHHMAYITTYADILDAQVFAGSKRLLGRKITDKDYTGCLARMRAWANTQSSRLAVLHAFMLLRETLVQSNPQAMSSISSASTPIQYSCRADPSIYRPWILYLAALTIWSFQYVLITKTAGTISQRSLSPDTPTVHTVACQYIIQCASVDSAERLLALTSAQGCAAVLQTLFEDFANAESELLVEASKRLRECGKLILTT